MKKAITCAAVAMMMLGLASCATGGRVSDDEKITNTINVWAESLKAKDVTKMLTVVSEKFSNADAQGKEALAGYMKNAIDAGYLEGVKVTTESAKRQKAEGKPQVEVYPIEVESNAGVATIGMTITKEGKEWLITNMDVQM